jgi:hypothetical protein
MEKIVKADLIIAILTYGNPNVFYELALCHVARKPFIQMIETGKDIPGYFACQDDILYFK